MPSIGDPLSPEEIANLGEAIPDDVTVVWGATHAGRFVPRGVRATSNTVLVGELGAGFDTSGPCASLCPVCGELLLVGEGTGALRTLKQAHLSVDHGVSVPLLS